MLNLPPVLLSAHLSAAQHSTAQETDRTERVDPYVSYMMHRESDLGDGEAVIQTLIWSSAFLETDGKGVGGGWEEWGVEAETSQQSKFLDTQMKSNR